MREVTDTIHRLDAARAGNAYLVDAGDRSVLVDDASLRLLAYSPTLGSEDEVRRTAILTRETPRVIRDLHFAQGIATATQPVTAPLDALLTSWANLASTPRV